MVSYVHRGSPLHSNRPNTGETGPVATPAVAIVSWTSKCHLVHPPAYAWSLIDVGAKMICSQCSRYPHCSYNAPNTMRVCFPRRLSHNWWAESSQPWGLPNLRCKVGLPLICTSFPRYFLNHLLHRPLNLCAHNYF